MSAACRCVAVEEGRVALEGRPAVLGGPRSHCRRPWFGRSVQPELRAPVGFHFHSYDRIWARDFIKFSHWNTEVKFSLLNTKESCQRSACSHSSGYQSHLVGCSEKAVVPKARILRAWFLRACVSHPGPSFPSSSLTTPPCCPPPGP